ncbi:class F sortase [Streptomyces fulvorobeus]|uniref:Class F sortase n=1 Tax=Streptomyces fulvorobeus TaxID=284028 RepID=A0A7J0CF75_9ACTN|nr:class F sortase [Streptomyces fulvorobeus]NYE44504.1 sortase (surface protein transpeptidase) [Streptomyces fulvorobeus]GFN01039.1 class F sortase [Streptomyces fulvorobeus]
MTGFRPRGRRGAYTAAAIAFTTSALVVLATALFGQHPPPAPPDTARAASIDEPRTPAPRSSPLPRSEPTVIRIPKIGVRTQIEKVTRSADGSVDMPTDPDHVGWYTGSVTPGETGNTVVVGHLDSRSGPAAFYGLGTLRKGSRITVTRRDGSTAHFAVTAMEVWAKDGFPSRRVYGPTMTPTLTLITCADWDDDRHTYRSNLVITAEPTTSPPGGADRGF